MGFSHHQNKYFNLAIKIQQTKKTLVLSLFYQFSYLNIFVVHVTILGWVCAKYLLERAKYREKKIVILSFYQFSHLKVFYSVIKSLHFFRPLKKNIFPSYHKILKTLRIFTILLNYFYLLIRVN